MVSEAVDRHDRSLDRRLGRQPWHGPAVLPGCVRRRARRRLAERHRRRRHRPWTSATRTRPGSTFSNYGLGRRVRRRGSRDQPCEGHPFTAAGPTLTRYRRGGRPSYREPVPGGPAARADEPVPGPPRRGRVEHDREPTGLACTASGGGIGVALTAMNALATTPAPKVGDVLLTVAGAGGPFRRARLVAARRRRFATADAPAPRRTPRSAPTSSTPLHGVQDATCCPTTADRGCRHASAPQPVAFRPTASPAHRASRKDAAALVALVARAPSSPTRVGTPPRRTCGSSPPTGSAAGPPIMPVAVVSLATAGGAVRTGARPRAGAARLGVVASPDTRWRRRVARWACGRSARPSRRTSLGPPPGAPTSVTA